MPAPKQRIVTARVTNQTFKALSMIARTRGWTISATISHLLRAAIADHHSGKSAPESPLDWKISGKRVPNDE